MLTEIKRAADAVPPDAPACPFCRQPGRDLFLYDEPSQADDSRLFAVICRACRAQGPRAYTAADAWRMWKQRRKTQ